MAERMGRICFFIPNRMRVELRRISQFDGRSSGEIVRTMIEQKISEFRRSEQQRPQKQG